MLAVAVLVWLLGAATTFWLARQETGELLDGQLAQTAYFVASLPTEELEEYEHRLSPPGRSQSRYEPDLGFQVWNRDGKLLFASADLPIAPRPAQNRLAVPRTVHLGEADWRAIAVTSSRTGHVVQVMAHRELGLEFATHVGAKFARSALLVVPLAVLLGGLAVRRTLRPIEALRDELSRREPGATAPLPTAGVPTELVGLIEAINGLSARHVALLGALRRFSEDAAHELRTPIASIRANAQVALGETTDEWLRAPLQLIEAESARIAALLDQLLTMGRLDHAELDLIREPTDLAALVEKVAAQAGVGDIVRPEGPALVRCVPNLIETALSNLLANARKHGGGELRVEIFAAPHGVGFAVEDDGPGVPAGLAEKLFEPFYRAPGTRAEGSGLGLSIVRRIAALHGGAVRAEAGRTRKGARLVFTLGPVSVATQP